MAGIACFYYEDIGYALLDCSYFSARCLANLIPRTVNCNIMLVGTLSVIIYQFFDDTESIAYKLCSIKASLHSQCLLYISGVYYFTG